uniref:6-phosphogluconolactonase n=1 Tax=Neobodo designis TaxID=312471 RepID=A0A7S1M2Q7_NEODS
MSSNPSRCSVSGQAAFVDLPANWKLRVLPTADDLAAESTYLIETITCDLARRPSTADSATGDDAAPVPSLRKLHLALSGGSTPKKIYESFARTYFFKQVLDKKAELNLWYGDVRMVPDAHADSNARMVTTALDGSFPDNVIHAVDVAAPAAEAAAKYAAQMLELMPTTDVGGVAVPVFDILLLGMGPDGHTASLFPGTDAPAARDAVCVTCMPGPDVKPRVERVTVTAPVIEAAKHVVLIAAGAEKKEAFRGLVASDAALAEHKEWLRPVIRLLRGCKGAVHLLVDKAIAEGCFRSKCHPVDNNVIEATTGADNGAAA